MNDSECIGKSWADFEKTPFNVVCLAIVLPLLSVVGIIGNGFCINVLLRERYASTILTVPLAVLDMSYLLVMLFSFLIVVPDYFGVLSEDLKKFHGIILSPMLQLLIQRLSGLMIVMMGVERMYAICKPLSFRKVVTRRLQWTLVVVVVTITMGLHVPTFFLDSCEPHVPKKNISIVTTKDGNNTLVIKDCNVTSQMNTSLSTQLINKTRVNVTSCNCVLISTVASSLQNDLLADIDKTMTSSKAKQLNTETFRPKTGTAKYNDNEAELSKTVVIYNTIVTIGQTMYISLKSEYSILDNVVKTSYENGTAYLGKTQNIVRRANISTILNTDVEITEISAGILPGETNVSDMSSAPVKGLVIAMSPTPVEEKICCMSLTQRKGVVSDISPTPTVSIRSDISPRPAESIISDTSPTPAESIISGISPTPAESVISKISLMPAEGITLEISPTPEEGFNFAFSQMQAEGFVSAISLIAVKGIFSDISPTPSKGIVSNMSPTTSEGIVSDISTTPSAGFVSDMSSTPPECIISDSLLKTQVCIVSDMLQTSGEDIVSEMLPIACEYIVSENFPTSVAGIVSSKVPLMLVESVVSDILPLKSVEDIITDKMSLRPVESSVMDKLLLSPVKSTVSDIQPISVGNIYRSFLSVTFGILSSIAVIVLNILLAIALYVKRRARSKLIQGHNLNSTSYNKEMRTSATLFAVIFIHCISILPFYIGVVLFLLNVLNTEHEEGFRVVTKLTGCLNASINFFIYYYRSQKFRSNVWLCLGCKSSRRLSSSTSE